MHGQQRPVNLQSALCSRRLPITYQLPVPAVRAAPREEGAAATAGEGVVEVGQGGNDGWAGWPAACSDEPSMPLRCACASCPRAAPKPHRPVRSQLVHASGDGMDVGGLSSGP